MKMRNLEGRDGLARDLAKLGNAIQRWKAAPMLQYARARRLSFHNTTNICVESCRDYNYVDASYLAGHVLMVSLCANVLTIIGVAAWLIL